ncbi:hypothetical protein HPK19_19460 [Arthrobacter citreus]|nr:hypothetical protein HPK19_19460 [Arthrobacter citreus]
MILNPPKTDGVTTLTNEEITTIKARLQKIIDGFVPNDYQEIVDTFYIVSTYNEKNVGHEINGDTAEYLLSYDPTEEVGE